MHIDAGWRHRRVMNLCHRSLARQTSMLLPRPLAQPVYGHPGFESFETRSQRPSRHLSGSVPAAPNSHPPQSGPLAHAKDRPSPMCKRAARTRELQKQSRRPSPESLLLKSGEGGNKAGRPPLLDRIKAGSRKPLWRKCLQGSFNMLAFGLIRSLLMANRVNSGAVMRLIGARSASRDGLANRE